MWLQKSRPANLLWALFNGKSFSLFLNWRGRKRALSGFLFFLSFKSGHLISPFLPQEIAPTACSPSLSRSGGPSEYHSSLKDVKLIHEIGPRDWNELLSLISILKQQRRQRRGSFFCFSVRLRSRFSCSTWACYCERVSAELGSNAVARSLSCSGPLCCSDDTPNILQMTSTPPGRNSQSIRSEIAGAVSARFALTQNGKNQWKGHRTRVSEKHQISPDK